MISTIYYQILPRSKYQGYAIQFRFIALYSIVSLMRSVFF